MSRKSVRCCSWATVAVVVGCLSGCAASTPAEKAKAELPGLIKKLKDPDPMTRAKAADQIRFLGVVHTKEAIPYLFANFEDEDEKAREWAAQGVAFYGDDAVPGIMEAVRSDSLRRRTMAYVALGGIAGEVKVKIADEAGPLLAKGLENEDPAVRRHAASALRFFGSLAKSTLPVQIKVLENEQDKFVLVFVLKGVATMGPDAKDALPVVEKHMESSDPHIVDLAKRAKFFIEGSDKLVPR